MFYLIPIIIIIILNYTINASLFVNIVNPFFWVILSIILLLILPKKYIKNKKDKQIIQNCAIAGLIYIIIFFCLGFLVTFGRNPYSVTIKGILMNLWVSAIPIIGKEYVRFKILKNANSKKQKEISILIIILYIFLELNIIEVFLNINNIVLIFKQIISIIIPLIIKNILFNNIVINGSAKGSITYELLINGFYWISPILPNAQWIIIAILDISIPFVLYILLIEKKENNRRLGRKSKENDWKGIISFCGLAIGISMFAVGVFPILPKAVATASMYPKIKIGDVVIIKKCDPKEIKIGDVIEYQIENQAIIHRVVNKEIENNEISFTTKGDNNKSEDANLVKEKQIVGKVIFKVDYIGLPSIWLHNIMKSEEKVLVETGK